MEIKEETREIITQEIYGQIALLLAREKLIDAGEYSRFLELIRKDMV